MYNHFLKKGKTKADPKKSSIKQAALQDSVNIYKVVGNYTPENFVSKVNRSKKVNVYRDIIDLETHKLSSLVPDIRFYRVQGDLYEPFYFPVASEIVTAESLLQPGSGVGGVGIRSFSANFTGNNPFSFDKEISCSLEIFVDNLENIFKEPPPGYARLADLFTISKRGYVSLKDGLSKEVSSEQVNRASNYEISVRLGYSVNSRSDILSAKEKQAILNTNLSIRMTLKDHSISVQQDGTASISIEYIGRLEGLLTDTALSLLKDEDDLLAISKFMIEEPDSKDVANMTKEEKEKLERRQKVKTKNRMRKYFGYLADDDIDSESDRLYSLPLSKNDIEAFKNFQSAEDREKSQEEKEYDMPDKLLAAAAETSASILKEFEDVPDDDFEKISALRSNEIDFEIARFAAEQAQKKLEAQTRRSKSIHYLYVGDILESVSYNIRANIDQAIAKAQKQETEEGKDNKKVVVALQRLKKGLRSMKILLGEVPIRVSDNKVIKVNIADIPITLEIFTKYFLDEIEQQSKTNLSIKKFLDDLTTRLIRKALAGHGSRDAPFVSQDVEIRTISITGPKSDSMKKNSTEVDIDQLPDFIRRGIPKNVDDEVEYYIVYSEMTNSNVTGLAGDIKEDVENGIYHFHIGKNRGMLKSINFNKFDVPFRKEALMLGSVNLYDELKMPYTATIEMFGNGLFLPGSMVYVNPSSIGFGDPRNKRSAAARLGLGGYYQILSVNTSFNGSSMTTTLQTSYTSWAENDTEFLAEITPHLESRVNESPETGTNTDAENLSPPEIGKVKSRDYETILASDLLTTKEKSDIIKMELSRRNTSDLIHYSKQENSRQYTTKRNSGLGNVTVKIGDNNEIDITRVL